MGNKVNWYYASISFKHLENVVDDDDDDVVSTHQPKPNVLLFHICEFVLHFIRVCLMFELLIG